MKPIGMAYAYWHFHEQHVRAITFDVEIAGNTETVPGRYYQLYQGNMQGVGFYLGFQTDVWHPSGEWRGYGLIFSRWGLTDETDARITQNGWIENPQIKEGGFVGVRTSLQWKPGRYICSLQPNESDDRGIWYEFRIKGYDSGKETYIGGLRFPNAGIDSGGITWTEAYPGRRQIDVAANPVLIPETIFCVNSLVANDGDVRPVRCDTCYNDDFQLSDASMSDGKLILRSGGNVQRVHAAHSYALDA